MLAPVLALAMMQQSATPPIRLPLSITCVCEDSLSKRYASKIRDLLATSPRYVEANSKKGLKLSIATIVDAGTKEDPSSIAASIVLLVDEIYISHWVIACGANRIDTCAANILAEVDSSLQ